MGQKAVFYLFYSLGVLFTALLLVATLLSWRASFVSPLQGGLWTTWALLMPVFLVTNLAVAIWWFIRRKWWVAMMPVAAIVFNMGYISATIRLPNMGGEPPKGDLRVATLNADGFRRYDLAATTIYGVAAMTQDEQVDVLCLQEVVTGAQVTCDSIAAYFAERMPYFVRQKGAVIVSRFPILRYQHVGFPDTDNDYLWADLCVGQDTVRVLSVHLQTSGVASMHRRFHRIYNRNMPLGTLFEEIDRNSRLRAIQVAEICNLLDTTRFPVIIAGDFNDTPSSYTYRQMKGNRTDGFRACGSGYGGTFRYIGGFLRIDYVLYDDAFRCVRYYMPDKDLSDHKTVIADLEFTR